MNVSVLSLLFFVGGDVVLGESARLRAGGGPLPGASATSTSAADGDRSGRAPGSSRAGPAANVEDEDPKRTPGFANTAGSVPASPPAGEIWISISLSAPCPVAVADPATARNNNVADIFLSGLFG